MNNIFIRDVEPTILILFINKISLVTDKNTKNICNNKYTRETTHSHTAHSITEK